MGLVGQLYYNVINVNEGDILTSTNADIYENLIGTDSNSAIKGQITKLGIQAEPGTRVELGINSNSANAIIMVGQSGTFELDAKGIAIGFLRFIRPQSYILDEAETATALNQGLHTMIAADQFKHDRLQLVDKSPNITKKINLTGYNTNSISPTVYKEMILPQKVLPGTEVKNGEIKNIPIYDKQNPNYTAYWTVFQDIHDQYLRFYNIGVQLQTDGLTGVYNAESPENQAHNELYNIIIDYVYTPWTQRGGN